jgi:Xaa-Pro aminopeptidase
VHAIEPDQIDVLPGKKLIYREWQLLKDQVKNAMFGNGRPKRIAMQYSANNDIPYISRVDAGTIEMVKSLGVNVDSSADLVQQFEAVWTPEQLQMHTEAAVKMQKIILETFAEIKRRINANIPTTENDVQQFMMKRYEEEGMNPSPMIVAVNANAASPHYFPSPGKGAPIKRGDLVLIDTVTKVKKPRAPAADLTWVGYVGQTVPEEYVKIWNIVFEAQQSALKAIRMPSGAGSRSQVPMRTMCHAASSKKQAMRTSSFIVPAIRSAKRATETARISTISKRATRVV